MHKEQAFALAEQLISALPCRRKAVDFWDMPLVEPHSNWSQWRKTADRLEALSTEVAPEVAAYFQIWASDAAIGAGDLDRGLALLPTPNMGERASLHASNSIDLKLSHGLLPNSRDITALFGPKVTAFGRENLDAIGKYIQVRLDGRAARGNPLSIMTWTSDAYQHKAGYAIFNGHPSYIVTKPPEGYHFNYSKVAEKDCISLIRDAENTWHEECDLPRIGEGWVSETRLFYELKAAFPDNDIVQHYRQKWLGRQHLDIAFPDMRVAIEYQGAQHDQPVAFFGGEEAFARTLERDRRKFNKCRRHGWRLIYAREGYALSAIIADVLSPNKGS